MRVAALWRYPVKSLRGEWLTEAALTSTGLGGDRGWAFVDDATGDVLSAKAVAKLLDGTAVIRDGRPVVVLPDQTQLEATDPANWPSFMRWLGCHVRVVAARPGIEAGFTIPPNELDPDDEPSRLDCPPGTFFDDAPVHALTTASLRAAAALAPQLHWDARRFRPNIVVEVAEDGFVEDGWVGRRLRVGEVEFEVARTTGRCIVTTHGQGPGRDGSAVLPVERDVLRRLRSERDGRLGVYLRPLGEGVVRREDPVTLLG